MSSDSSTLKFREDGTPFRDAEPAPEPQPLDAELAALLLPRMVDALGEALTACELRLYALSNRGESEAERERHECLARELYRRRQDVLEAFRNALTAQRADERPEPEGALRVADPARHECELALRLLLRRAVSRLAAQHIADFPFGTAAMAAAAQRAFAELSLSVDVELQLYKFLERRLLSRLGTLHAAAKAELCRGSAEPVMEPVGLAEPVLDLELGLGGMAPGLGAEDWLPAVGGLGELSLDAGAPSTVAAGGAEFPTAAPELPLVESVDEDEAEADLVWPVLRVLAGQPLAEELRAPLWTLVTALNRLTPAPAEAAPAVAALEAWLAAGVGQAGAGGSGAQVVLANLLLEQIPALCAACAQGPASLIVALHDAARAYGHWLPGAETAPAGAEWVQAPEDFLGDTVELAAGDAVDFEHLAAAARQREAEAPKPPADWKEWLAAQAGVPAAPERLAELKPLAPGDWLSFEGAGLPALRCKVVAHLQGPERYLLCDWRGRKLAEATPLQLAAALAQGVLTLDVLSLRLDKPLELLMGTLKQRKE